MDPLCHTLTGAALGRTGLQNRSRFALPTLIIAANLPDIDAVAYLVGGVDTVAIRRGVTHGIPALIILPLLLALVMKGLAMSLPGRAGKPEADFRQLWLLSVIAMSTHPFLDFLNNYGMRWLMPFVDRWVYGDTLFIVDPIVWAMLLAGVVLAAKTSGIRQPWWRQPAVAALAVTTAYIAVSAGGTLLARNATLAALPNDPPLRFMASPVFAQPLQRQLVLEYEQEYRLGTVHLLPGLPVEIEAEPLAKGDPADFGLAAGTRDGAIFLHWARFPFIESRVVDDQHTLRIMDARYVREWEGEEFGAVELNLVYPVANNEPFSRRRIKS
ncbi:MAG: metal-dependent hydrolase, partial [Woeseia sp.]